MSVHYLDFNKKELELQNGVRSWNVCDVFSETYFYTAL